MAAHVLYREFHMLRWVVWALGVLAGVLTAATLAGQGVFAVAAIFVVLVAWMLAGVHRWNRIVLTDRRLTVGTESFRPSDFDFSFGVQPPLVLSPDEQGRIEEEWPLPPDHELHVAGGSWGRRRGTAMVVLRERQDRRLIAVFTRRPSVLDPLLTEWLEST